MEQSTKRYLGGLLATSLLFAGVYLTSRKAAAPEPSRRAQAMAKARGFIDRARQKDYAWCYAHLDESMQLASSPDQLARTFEPLFAALGPCHRMGKATWSHSEDLEPGYWLCQIKGECQRGPVAFTFLFTPEDQIGGLYIK